jgi:tetratricopeptide (TPR) repeat protein
MRAAGGRMDFGEEAAVAEPSQRMTRLQAMLEKQPNDPFLLYSLGMEYKNAGDPARALEWFDRTLRSDPNYCYAYFQKGQTLETTGDADAAKRTYRDGIEAAKRSGDEHARSELQGALEMIE